MYDDWYNWDTTMRLNEVYSRLAELTSGETDPEQIQYNECLLDAIQEAIQKIYRLERGNKTGKQEV